MEGSAPRSRQLDLALEPLAAHRPLNVTAAPMPPAHDTPERTPFGQALPALQSPARRATSNHVRVMQSMRRSGMDSAEMGAPPTAWEAAPPPPAPPAMPRGARSRPRGRRGVDSVRLQQGEVCGSQGVEGRHAAGRDARAEVLGEAPAPAGAPAEDAPLGEGEAAAAAKQRAVAALQKLFFEELRSGQDPNGAAARALLRLNEGKASGDLQSGALQPMAATAGLAPRAATQPASVVAAPPEQDAEAVAPEEAEATSDPLAAPGVPMRPSPMIPRPSRRRPSPFVRVRVQS